MQPKHEQHESGWMTRRYIVALTAIALLAISAFTALELVIVQQEHTGALVNVSGRQRMLSQRATLYAQQVVLAENAVEHESFKAELAKTVDLIEKSHIGLTQGDAELGLPADMSETVQQMYFGGAHPLDQQMKGYIAALRNVLAADYGELDPNQKEITFIFTTATGPLLQALDAMVWQYQWEGEAVVDRLHRMEMMVLALTLFTLLVEALFVFRPMVQQVSAQIRKLSAISDKLTLEIREREHLENDLERQLLEKTAALVQQQYLLDQTGMLANLGGWVIDVETQNVDWSKQLYAIHEIGEGQKPQTLEEALAFFPDSARARVIASLEHAVETGEPYDIEVPFVTAKGRRLWTRSICMPETVNGKVVKLYGAFQDITAQKNTEFEILEEKEKAQKADKAKSEFLASMSHELRTPLNAIIGFGQMLEYSPQTPLTPVQSEHVSHILEGGAHLLQLVNQILDLAQVEADHIDLKLDIVTANSVIADCVNLMEPQAKEKSVKIHNTVGPQQLHEIQTDATRFKQIMLNVLSNAVKYNKPDGFVKITAEETSEGFLKITVADGGVGIPEDMHDKVFEVFKRVGDDPYVAREGTGVGLTVTKTLVERMAGRIGFESTPNVGSTFWIELPLANNDNVLIWTDAVRVGVDAIDKDHQVLVSLLNQAQNCVHLGNDVSGVVAELVRYTKHHFAREEAIMAVCEYPGLEDHKVRHAKLSAQVDELATQWRSDPTSDACLSIHAFIQSWLFEHIISEDTKITAYTIGRDEDIREALADIQ